MPAQKPAPRESSALRVLRGALLERLPLKAVALLLAFVLWLAVSADEPAEQTVPVRLALRIDSSIMLSAAPPYVNATLTGRRRDLLKVNGGDLVLRRTIGSTTADSMRVVLLPSDVELPPGMEGDVRVRDVQPRVLTLRFAHVAQRASAAWPTTPRMTRQRALAARRSPRAVTTEDVHRDTVWRRAAGALAADSMARDESVVEPLDSGRGVPQPVVPSALPRTPPQPGIPPAARPIVPPAPAPDSTTRPGNPPDSSGRGSSGDSPVSPAGTTLPRTKRRSSLGAISPFVVSAAVASAARVSTL